jgi:hypothetical protein
VAQQSASRAHRLDGRTVDLRTACDLSRFFRDEIERSAEVQYAA